MKKSLILFIAGIICATTASAAIYSWQPESPGTDNSNGNWVSDGSGGSDIYVVDQTYKFNSGSTYIVSKLPNNVLLDFGLNGCIYGTGSQNNMGFGTTKQPILTATVNTTIEIGSPLAAGLQVGDLVVVTRWLFEGQNIWNRESGINLTASYLTEENGGALNRIDGLNVGGAYEASFSESQWKNGTCPSVDESKLLNEGDYAFVYSYQGGTGIQYVARVVDTQAIPEPATATLGLAGLAALGLSRRRRS